MVLPRATMLRLPTPLGPTKPSPCPATHLGTTPQVHKILHHFVQPACTPSLERGQQETAEHEQQKYNVLALSLAGGA